MEITGLERPPVAVVRPPVVAQLRRPVGAVLRAYLALTKPRIIELLLVTAVPSMVVAAHGRPRLATIGATLLGGSLAAGSANALNCYFDRDIDAKMRRTACRPLATRTGTRLTPGQALGFGLLLGAVATVWLTLVVGGLAAGLADGAIAFYVLVYTLLLKRRTPQNIVIGGAAGAFPVLVGWAAVTGRLGLAPLVMAGIVFLWTPPHFWALAIRFRDDYAAAEVPMAPVVQPPGSLAWQLLAYSYATVAASFLVVPTAHTGWLYPAAAAVLAVPFLAESHALAARLRHGVAAGSMRLFHYSIGYLGLLFAAIALDGLIFRG